MSDDLIRRSDAIKALNREKSDWNCDYNVPIDNCIKRLNKVKSADRPQGEWIDKGWKGDWQFETDGRGSCWRVFECSVCNGWNTRKTHFCPHCGAKMKGADDETD